MAGADPECTFMAVAMGYRDAHARAIDVRDRLEGRFALDAFKDTPREQEQISSATRELELIK